MLKKIIRHRLFWPAVTTVLILTAIGLTLAWPHREFLLDWGRDRLEVAWAFLEETPPLLFFSLLATLPALGFPISPFYLIAGDLYGSAFSIVGAGVALLVSMSFGYWLGSGIFRPLIEKLIARSGYKVPEANADNYLQITLILRITPGIPFFMQNYLCGMAHIPFRFYHLISWPIQILWAIGFITLGESLMEGKAGTAFAVIGFIIALALVTRMLRQRYAGKANGLESPAKG